MSEQRQARRRPPVAAEFMDLVRAMRKAQRDYFAHRTGGFLRVVVAAERKVDDAIRQWEAVERDWVGLVDGLRTDEAPITYNFLDGSATEEEKKA